LDSFGKTPDDSRKVALEVLRNIRTAWQINPGSIFIVSFFDAKASEIVNIFSEGELQVRREAHDLLLVIDPKRNIYERILGNQ
jgi:hypothetical protein